MKRGLKAHYRQHFDNTVYYCPIYCVVAHTDNLWEDCVSVSALSVSRLIVTVFDGTYTN